MAFIFLVCSLLAQWHLWYYLARWFRWKKIVRFRWKKSWRLSPKENRQISLRENSLEFPREKLSNFPREHHSVQKENSLDFRWKNM